MLDIPPVKVATIPGQEAFSNFGDYSRYAAEHGPQAQRHSRARWEGIVSLAAVAVDLAMILLGFCLAFWFRYRSGFVFAIQPEATITDYWKLISFGSALVFGGLLAKGSYEFKDLLNPANTMAGFIVILSAGLFIFIGISLTVSTVPPISRAYVITAWIILFLSIYGGRLMMSLVLRHPSLMLRMRKRLVVVGAGPETMRIKAELAGTHDTEFVGWVQANRPNRFKELEESRLGSLHELDGILKKHSIDVAVLTESETLQHEGILFVMKVCEREHVQFKLVPHFFEILISGLRPSVVGGVPVMGVDSLPLNAYQNRIVKRMIDILGASVGLLFSWPLILFFGALVYLESPGAVFYRQVRSGRNGRLFNIIKIRSMRMDAEKSGMAHWAKENDPRRLKIGAFMRKWNIDELPQFWNVLKGDMSLVGPRPERPELIERFKFTIPHYQSRNTCLPGMSGWAQVNGWRGNTDLEERIRCDIWYVEHWNLLLDFRIILMTFFRQQNAY